ncbi:glycosyltransferase family 2 protein [Parvibaculum sp.]|uniref:glycosyltransferase family 2 protein n=1 Tax=Parvibaculum sp. TaxID=2024848 RepID=UPI00391D6A4B
MDRPRLAILIPAFREEATIGKVVAAARDHADVIVVDDASPDATGEKAAEAGAIVIRNETNLGYDGTLNRAFEEAMKRGYTHAITMDADGEHDPALVAKFKELLTGEGVALVLGVRPRKQRLAEVVMGLYVRLRFGAGDILCGMKGYDLKLAAENGGFDHTNSIGTELAINSLRRGARFRQVPVSGTRRQDAPRFDRRLRANLRILVALGNIMRDDAKNLFGRSRRHAMES